MQARIGGDMDSIGYARQRLLERHVAECMIGSRNTLDDLGKMTGLSRAKLGRLRLGKARITCDEAYSVFSAVNSHGRALLILACLGEETRLTGETLAYLDLFLSDLPHLLTRLNDLGPTLNPRWARGSIHHLGALMKEHADRRIQAEAFVVGGERI